MERFNWKDNGYKILDGTLKVQYRSGLRRFILNNKIFDYKCNKCGICEWNGDKITLEIEHKDGDHWNNMKENLELLCPNCHSQTLNYRKKNFNQTKEKKKFCSEQDILIELNLCNNINQVLTNLKLSNSGGNYKTVHKVIKKHNLENFYNIPTPQIKEKKYKRSLDEILNERVEFLKHSNIDFSIKGWGVKLGNEWNLTPYASMSWVKNNLPSFHDKCWKHIEKKN
jgi:hypothetical protein